MLSVEITIVNAIKTPTAVISIITHVIIIIAQNKKMDEMNQQQNQAAGVQIKRLFPSEISRKFRSKADFLRYFREQCKCISSVSPCPIGQLYTPPKLMINKDFIRQLLTEEKELVEMDRLLPVNVPMYDELSVK